MSVFPVEIKSVGERLRETRLKRVLTQQQLADAARVQPVTISRIENGKIGALPRQSTMQRIAAVLQVPVAWLMYGDDNAGNECDC